MKAHPLVPAPRALPDGIRERHQRLARALLQNRHPWPSRDLMFLRAMVVAPNPSASQLAKLGELRQVLQVGDAR